MHVLQIIQKNIYVVQNVWHIFLPCYFVLSSIRERWIIELKVLSGNPKRTLISILFFTQSLLTSIPNTVECWSVFQNSCVGYRSSHRAQSFMSCFSVRDTRNRRPVGSHGDFRGKCSCADIWFIMGRLSHSIMKYGLSTHSAFHKKQ